MSSALRWGVIGLGRAGQAKLKAISELGLERAKLTAIASRRALPEPLHETHPALKKLSWEELICDPDVDAVAVCTESALHEQQARAALLAGKHVLVDFPLCSSERAFIELHQLAEASGLTLHQELIGLLSPGHTMLEAQITPCDPLASLTLEFSGGLSGWVHHEANAGRWAPLALGRLQRAWGLVGPMVITGHQLTFEEGGYTLGISLLSEGGAEVRLREARHPNARRTIRVEARSQAGRALHCALPHPLPRPEVSLFTQDLICFDQRVRRLAALAPSSHYVPYHAQLGVMRLIDELTARISAEG